MKTVTIVAPEGRRNFHNMDDISIRVPDTVLTAMCPTCGNELIDASNLRDLDPMGDPWGCDQCHRTWSDEEIEMRVRLSASQVRRIQRHFCPSRSSGCVCGSGVSINLDDYYARPAGGTIIVAADDIS